MRNDDGGGTCHDGQTKDFAGMTEDRVHGADGHQIVTLDAFAGVEDEDH